MMPSISIRQLTDEFCKEERSLGLFDLRVLGVQVWGLMRLAVFNNAFFRVGLISSDLPRQRRLAVKPRSPSVWTGIGRLMCPLWPYRRGGIWFVPAEVRFSIKGRLVDPLTAALSQEIRPEHVCILDMLNTMQLDSALGRVMHASYIERLANMIQVALHSILRFGRLLGLFKNSSQNLQAFDRAGARLVPIIGDVAPLSSYALSFALWYLPRLWLYRICFALNRPIAIVLCVPYGKEPITEAAKAAKIPVIELQHGVIGPHHLAYHFPGVPQRVLGRPDLLVVWGEYWRSETAFYPGTVVEVAASAHLMQNLEVTDAAVSSEILVVSSQPFVGSIVIDTAKALAVAYPGTTIRIRPHPNQIVEYRDAFEADEFNNIVVDDSKTPIITRLEHARCVVTGPSTVLFQAIAYHCRLVVMASGYDFWLKLLLRDTGAVFAEGPNAAVSAVATSISTSGAEQFFSTKADLTKSVVAKHFPAVRTKLQNA